MLVPRCKATMSGKKLLLRTRSPQPKRPGSITVCPRLLIGNSSVIPCSKARKIICQILRFTDYLLSLVQVLLHVLLEFIISFGVNDSACLGAKEIEIVGLCR